MRVTLRLFGRELFAFEVEQNQGIRELAGAIGELAARPEPEILSEADDDTEMPKHMVQHATDAWVERDHNPHDSTLGWRDDAYTEPCPGVPSATTFGFTQRG